MEWLRWLGPLGLAAIGALAMDQLTQARGLQPPGFRNPVRRGIAAVVLTFVFWIGIFMALGQLGRPQEVDFQAIHTVQLFSLHALFVGALLAWFLLAFSGMAPGETLPRLWARQLGFYTPRPLRELAIGGGLGLLVWPALLLVVGMVALFLFLSGGEDLLPTAPPPMIVWIASLPVAVRLGVALSAGVVEEAFFRGFLQPRMGIALSTLLFVLAHLSYDQPFMLVGITLLSLFFAFLTRWRQNIWPAVVAHFLFDGVQLLVVIPWALRQWGAQAGKLSSGGAVVALSAGVLDSAPSFACRRPTIRPSSRSPAGSRASSWCRP